MPPAANGGASLSGGWITVALFTMASAALAPALAQDSLGCPGPSLDEWLTLGGSSTRAAVRGAAAPSLSADSWKAVFDETGTSVRFFANVPPVVIPRDKGNLVIALGRVSRPGGPTNQTRLFAFSRESGAGVWSCPVPSPVLDSISSPVVDLLNRTAIMCTGRFVTAVDLDTGAQRWQRQLDRSVVNATPVITTDLAPRNRLFITDYEGFFSGAQLYCINLDPASAANPFAPGQIIWTAAIGSSSGNSPAYLAGCQGGLGMVYVATSGPSGVMGDIRAYPATALASPAPFWISPNPSGLGYFGPVTVVAPPTAEDSPVILAATYAFDGDTHSADLVKVDGATGQLIWFTPCNRTVTAPVPLPGGRILLSGGYEGFGTVPTLDLYTDLGASVTQTWSSLDTWNDLNEDGYVSPGEYLRIGGWMQQPIALHFAGHTYAYVGVLPSEPFPDPVEELYLVNVDRTPTCGSFFLDKAEDTGGPPVFAGDLIYSGYSNQLSGFGIAPAHADIDMNGRVNLDDIYAWEHGDGDRDVDRSGDVNAGDRACLVGKVRAPEFGAWWRVTE